MKIACVILGTRGDVQPMLALAVELMKRGHERNDVMSEWKGFCHAISVGMSSLFLGLL